MVLQTEAITKKNVVGCREVPTDGDPGLRSVPGGGGRRAARSRRCSSRRGELVRARGGGELQHPAKAERGAGGGGRGRSVGELQPGRGSIG